MNFPSNLTDRLLEFVLDNHTSILLCATAREDDLRNQEKQTIRTGIENILVDALEDPSMKVPPTLPVETAVAEATEAIWGHVLGTFDDNVWLDKDERIVFFTRWETAFKEATATLLTRLLEDV